MSMKIKLLQDQKLGKKGDIVEVPDKEGDILTREELAEKAPKESLKEQSSNITDKVGEDTERSGSSKGKGPLWSERYGLTENSNIAVQVWSSDQYDNPYITISRGEKGDDGNWENNRMNIPIGKAVELAERIKQAAFVVREKS